MRASRPVSKSLIGTAVLVTAALTASWASPAEAKTKKSTPPQKQPSPPAQPAAADKTSGLAIPASKNPIPFQIGLWLQAVGTTPTDTAATMSVNLNLSATPQNGQFWQGYRSKWVDPALYDMCQGDVLLLHVSYGHTPSQPYTLQDFDVANRTCPMLTNWDDYKAAWGTIPAGVEFVPYLGAPTLAGKGSVGKNLVNQYLAPYDAMGVRVAFDASSLLGGPDTQIKSAVLAYHAKHGILVEPWITGSSLNDANGVGIVCTTLEIANWRSQPGRQPAWFPLKPVIKRPVWFIINDLPANWGAMSAPDRDTWMANRAIDIALDGDVPLVPMACAGCIKQFNTYFGRR